MAAEWGNISSEEIAAAIGGRIVCGDPRTRFSGFSSDSRTVGQGDVFWAIKGECFDGHDFVSRAAKGGAAGVIVRDEFLASLDNPPNTVVISVGDTLRALGDLAGPGGAGNMKPKWRAITGSSGKTTAKEMTAAILQSGQQNAQKPGQFQQPYRIARNASEARKGASARRSGNGDES